MLYKTTKPYKLGKAVSMSRLDRIPPSAAAGSGQLLPRKTSLSSTTAGVRQQQHHRRPIGQTPKKLSMSMGHLGNKTARVPLHAAGSPAAASAAAAVTGRPPRHHRGPPVSQSAKAKYSIEGSFSNCNGRGY